MPTPGERRALIFIASIAALGVAVRGWREFHPLDPGALAGNRAALARQIEAVDSAIAVTSSKRIARAPRSARAPGTGAPSAAPVGTRALAGSAATDAQRSRAAPDLRPSRSRGRQLAQPDTPPRDPRQAYWDRSLYFDSVRLASVREAAGGRGNVRDFRAPPSGSRQRAALKSAPPIDLDVASMDEVATLPLIGSALARRIVANRVNDGPFGSITGLQRVSGITPAFARRLEPFVTFSGSPRLGSTGESPPRSKSERRPRGEARP